ncbi:MAG: PilZ domain-containing protein [Candidatus Omnitrophica bacterium]|nr:PilZ domain-containing protein [Candidatus Omnitrophota bacterium]
MPHDSDMEQIEEQREFLRMDHETAVDFREVKTDKLSNKSHIMTRNISASGLLFRTTNIPPALSSTIWVQLDDKMLNICSEIEEDLIMKDEGVLGRVVRISEGEPGVSYDIGICFIRKSSLSEVEIQQLSSI